jgi:hypothetical protein
VRRASRFLETRSLDRRKKRIGMLLENKNAVIYGAGGSIGGAVAKFDVGHLRMSPSPPISQLLDGSEGQSLAGSGKDPS